ncbi:Death-associated protein kinase 1, partial [Goodea atripinnis]
HPLEVVLVATHADLADITRAFSGEFSYDKEKALLKEVRNRFGNDLQISDKLFVMDTGASNSKDLKLLRSHLQELRANIISRCSPMTQLSERLLAALPSWRKLSGPNQLTSWQQFVNDVQEQINPLVSQDHLRTLAMQLHSMGEREHFVTMCLPDDSTQKNKQKFYQASAALCHNDINSGGQMFTSSA